MDNLEVEFRGLDDSGDDKVLGSVVLDNGSLSSRGFESDVLSQNILGTPIQVGDGEPMESQEDPEKWMHSLYLHYRSAYLRASKVKTLETEEVREERIFEAALKEAGFSGKITDKRGRERCYSGGKEVPCGDVAPAKTTEKPEPKEKQVNPEKGKEQPATNEPVNEPKKDPAANRPSKPDERHEGSNPKVLEWQDPPEPKGVKGGGKAVRPTGDRSQTRLGDIAEETANKLGFRNILPPGRRSNKDVKTEGSSIDVEFDHSGRAMEVKMCKTTATEYRAKPKADEVEDKLRYAKMHDLTPYTMLAVMDEDARQIHYYVSKEPGISRKKLSKDSFDFIGTVKY